MVWILHCKSLGLFSSCKSLWGDLGGLLLSVCIWRHEEKWELYPNLCHHNLQPGKLNCYQSHLTLVFLPLGNGILSNPVFIYIYGFHFGNWTSGTLNWSPQLPARTESHFDRSNWHRWSMRALSHLSSFYLCFCLSATEPECQCVQSPGSNIIFTSDASKLSLFRTNHAIL